MVAVTMTSTRTSVRYMCAHATGILLKLVKYGSMGDLFTTIGIVCVRDGNFVGVVIVIVGAVV